LAGIAAATAASLLLFDGRAATIESVYGVIPASLPALTLPDLSWGVILTMLPSALLIAALGSIESLLSAVVADGMTGTRHNSNRELVGQGIANIVTPLFGGIPATGAIARTAANIRTGAVSRMSGVIHGAVVLLVLVLLAPQASKIPLAAMAPVLMVVAWNMSERKAFKDMLKKRSPESVVLVATFVLTVFVNLIAGVGCGIALVLLYRLREAVRRRGAVRSPAAAFADLVPLSRRRGRG
jgi:Sulfate permease and related transporters (MFS superfamily)